MFLPDILQITSKQGNAVFTVAEKKREAEWMFQKIYGKCRNRETLFSWLCGQLFTCCWPAIWVKSFNLEKKLEGSHRKNESKTFYKKIACQFLEDFPAEIDVAFNKSDNTFCAFKMLNVDILSKTKKWSS